MWRFTCLRLQMFGISIGYGGFTYRWMLFGQQIQKCGVQIILVICQGERLRKKKYDW